MARRRSKKRQQEDALDAFLKASVLLVAWFSYYLSKSFQVTGVITGAYIGLLFVIGYAIKQQRKERLRSSRIDDIDKMEGRQFEKYLVQLFTRMGYQVNLTPAAGDYGADLILLKNGKKIAVQAKRYSKNVGVKAVQEVQTSVAYYGASEAWVITNADYTEQAYTLAKSNSVKLINREELIEMILRMKSSGKTKSQAKAV